MVRGIVLEEGQVWLTRDFRHLIYIVEVEPESSTNVHPVLAHRYHLRYNHEREEYETSQLLPTAELFSRDGVFFDTRVSLHNLYIYFGDYSDDADYLSKILVTYRKFLTSHTHLPSPINVSTLGIVI